MALLAICSPREQNVIADGVSGGPTIQVDMSLIRATFIPQIARLGTQPLWPLWSDRKQTSDLLDRENSLLTVRYPFIQNHGYPVTRFFTDRSADFGIHG